MHEVKFTRDTGPDGEPADAYWDVVVEGVVRARVPAYGVDTADGQSALAERIGRVLDIRPDDKKISLEDLVEDLYLQLDTAEISLLQQRGWKHTSSTPNHAWRWVKTLDDATTIMCRRVDALSIEGVYR